ncbi:hypothetical protein ILP97_07035 [Amycolatopsis sp. H6(2020)]|nr:hypothetical protein [Amycolatopsis sp. H6(2020)]
MSLSSSANLAVARDAADPATLGHSRRSGATWSKALVGLIPTEVLAACTAGLGLAASLVVPHPWRVLAVPHRVVLRLDRSHAAHCLAAVLQQGEGQPEGRKDNRGNEYRRVMDMLGRNAKAVFQPDVTAAIDPGARDVVESRGESSAMQLDVLRIFSASAKEMNTFLGFPGVLLLFGVAALVLSASNLGLDSIATFIIVGLSLLTSLGAYFVQWVVAVRRAEAQAAIVRDFKMLLVNQYLEHKNEIHLEDVRIVMDDIINRPVARELFGGYPELL